MAAVLGTPVSRETKERLASFADMLRQENERQNLVSKASLDALWTRHIADSAQLIRFAPVNAEWLDIGSGPGLPGLVLAILGVKHVTMVEPRRLRTDFLERVSDALALKNVAIVTGKVEQVTGSFDVITARAVASLDKLFALSVPRSHGGSRWVLPKGRSAAMELAEARSTWQGEFRLEASATDPEARILVAEKVRKRMGRG
ncbi:16S rRNA (guanine(527)-N(7))-methyltransferase RsmG [Sphingomonas astaxanthinifaciens]|uniref:Ribosomal RNA small subunit methyltransferase G n=1 Tax=Sphingomonas astaxanthinifaciens DSM 22298 TaxID=1123267 RepID=A0ABQ5Z7D6_9SPHN|nr:16S rRNA (guanine(527)-N(7))-methyltransferase RsmG [Sphingomonas astaxanthinifaciens]GLR46773.1 hypothetical protein GCM10007925_04840 [Sphingomonas astaxanthinifaciens DSM 22298]